MQFSLADHENILESLEKYVVEGGNKERVRNIKLIFKNIKRGAWTVQFGFTNDCGERYLCISDIYDKYIWFGDESDWGGASSYYEDNFMHDVMSLLQIIGVKKIELNKVGIYNRKLRDVT